MPGSTPHDPRDDPPQTLPLDLGVRFRTGNRALIASVDIADAMTGACHAPLFFHVRSPDEFLRDDEGMELQDLAAVRQEAEAAARGVLAEAIEAGRIVDHQSFDVTDETGNVVLVYPLRDAMKLA